MPLCPGCSAILPIIIPQFALAVTVLLFWCSTAFRPCTILLFIVYISITLNLVIYIQPCMLIILLVLSGCQTPICSQFRLFALHSAPLAPALQLLKMMRKQKALMGLGEGQLFPADLKLTTNRIRDSIH